MFAENNKVRDFSVIASLPPQSIESEEAILGGILFDPSAIARVADFLKPEAFYINAHKDIYQAAIALHSEKRCVGILAVTEWLSRNGLLEQVGGRNKLAHLYDVAVSAINIDGLAEVVIEKYQRRQMISLGIKISQLGNDNRERFDNCVEKMQEEVFKFGQSSSMGAHELEHVSEIIPGFLESVEKQYQGAVQPGIKTGFYDFDAMTGGMEGNQLIILAARPSMGKSACALEIAWNVATAENKPVYFFSLEMSKKQIIRRKIATLANVDATLIRQGRLSESQWSALKDASEVIHRSKLFFCDSSEIQVKDLKRSVMKTIAKYGEYPGMIVVDYLQLLAGVGEEDSNQYQTVTKVSRQLKKLAGELDIPILALSQLNRSVESRTVKRPQMSDLRDSGAIEQDADLICLLYRDEYYNTDSPDKGLAELIVAKQRDGATGTIKLLFDSQFATFKNLSKPNGRI